MSKTLVKSCLLAAVVAFGGLAQPALADPGNGNTPPAQGGDWHNSDEFLIWMAFVHMLGLQEGFSDYAHDNNNSSHDDN